MKYNYEKEVLAKFPKFCELNDGIHFAELQCVVSEFQGAKKGELAPLYGSNKRCVVTDFKGKKFANELFDYFGAEPWDGKTKTAFEGINEKMRKK